MRLVSKLIKKYCGVLSLIFFVLYSFNVLADVPAKYYFKARGVPWLPDDQALDQMLQTKRFGTAAEACGATAYSHTMHYHPNSRSEVWSYLQTTSLYPNANLSSPDPISCQNKYNLQVEDFNGSIINVVNYGAAAYIYFYCDTNPLSTYENQNIVCSDPISTLNPRGAAGNTCEASKHPISYGYGNKFLDEQDYVSTAIGFPVFSRFYNSTSAVNHDLHWINNYNRFISVKSYTAFAYRPDGKVFYFRGNSLISWIPDADISDKLVELKDQTGSRIGWSYISDRTGEVETYSVDGRLLHIQDRAGLTQTLTYSCKTVSATCPSVTPDNITYSDNLIINVVDHTGHSLNFTYDNLNRIKTMINPAGGVYTYAYDANNNLSSVTYPDSTLKTYHYSEVGHVSATPAVGVSNVNLLTGITDEKSNRYADYYYDANGRAIDENLAGGVEATNLVYNTDGSGNPTSTVVTDSRGNARTYNFTTVLGVVKSTGQSQPAGSGCSAAASALTYDANGNVASRVDFNGNKTTYVYDLARNLETSRTEGLTTAGAATTATHTITITWHSTWRLPLVVSEYSGSTGTGTPLKRTTNVYDSKGNITSYTEEDPVRSLSRTTTTTYTYSTTVPGLVLEKVVDGPRTGTADSTTYTYYPHDATCVASAATPIVDPVTSTSPANLGCRGQLASVVTPVGTTTYDRYNHHGQIEQLTDPNAVVTEFAYDLRQRLTSKTTGTESTQFTYDDAGLLIQTKFPDNSELNYVYDNAHRLTEISNTTGDKVVYTLDSEGNRIQEEMYDPNGFIAKSLTRQFDALNRAQEVTGE